MRLADQYQRNQYGNSMKIKIFLCYFFVFFLIFFRLCKIYEAFFYRLAFG